MAPKAFFFNFVKFGALQCLSGFHLYIKTLFNSSSY